VCVCVCVCDGYVRREKVVFYVCKLVRRGCRHVRTSVQWSGAGDGVEFCFVFCVVRVVQFVGSTWNFYKLNWIKWFVVLYSYSF